MTHLEKSVRDYFDNYKEINICEHQSMALTFSFLLGLPVEECKYMYPESEWSDEEYDQYDEVEGIINKMKYEQQEKN